MMNPFEEYMKLLGQQIALVNNGLDETELATKIKTRMKQLWYKLTSIQRDQIDSLRLL